MNQTLSLEAPRGVCVCARLQQQLLAKHAARGRSCLFATVYHGGGGGGEEGGGTCRRINYKIIVGGKFLFDTKMENNLHSQSTFASNLIIL